MTTLSTQLEIDPTIVKNNIEFLKNKIKKSSKFMAIIKSDAYGHILPNIVADIDDQVDGYGVVRLEEAIELRKISNKKISQVYNFVYPSYEEGINSILDS